MNATLTAQQRAVLGVVIGQLLCISVVALAVNVIAAEASARDQAGWLAVGIAAALASCLVNGVWLVGLRRAVAQRQREVLGRYDP